MGLRGVWPVACTSHRWGGWLACGMSEARRNHPSTRASCSYYGCGSRTANTGTSPNTNHNTGLLLQMMVALDATKGIMRALDLHPVLALSGPNYGPNMGTDVLLR